jgi:pimeloyl-ACP methyl ester carboxylesterase
VPHAEVNGHRLYYEVHGEGDPLVIVMGLGGDLLAWARQIPAWSAKYRVIAIENRDVGRSSYADGPYEIADMAADTLAVADELGIDDFHLLGVSMGGAIAQEVALSAPERVITLTLAVTFAAGGGWARSLAETWGKRRLTQSREQFVDEIMLMNMSEEFYENAEGVAFARQMMLANPHPQAPEAFARQLDASSRHDTRDRLGSLSMPVHVIGGEHDLLVPVWKSKEIAELIPSAKLTIVERSPHGMNIERAQEFNDAVLDFIASAPAAQPAG